MTGIDRGSATTLAMERVNALAREAGIEFQLLNDATVEIARGWVFFYNSAEYIRTGRQGSALAGNGPILVTREGGIHHLPTAVPWEDNVDKV